MTTVCETMIRPAYDAARAAFPGVLPAPATVTFEDFDGPANAESGVVPGGGLLFRWRLGFPHPLMDEPLRTNEIRRVRAHEVGHAYENALRALGRDPGPAYWAFRGFSLTWAAWDARFVLTQSYGDAPRESFADCFAAALNGEWLVPDGTANAERFSEGPSHPVTPAAALAFFKSLAPAAPAPAPEVSPVKIIDIRTELPFDVAYLPSPALAPKSSLTVHWPGGDFDVVTDDDAIALMHAFAQYHIDKDWALQIDGVQHGAGIMYAEAIAPSGTVLIMRDPDAVLWHSDTTEGNLYSRAILVICSDAHPMTDAQRVTLRSRLTLPTWPHSHWTDTECPGAVVRAFLGGEEFFDMDEATFRRILREEVTTPLSEKLNAGFNVTTVVMLRRALRTIGFWLGKGGYLHDPGGRPNPGADPSAYPDDTTPIA